MSEETREEVQRRIAYLRSHREEIAGRLVSVTARCGMMHITKGLARFKIGTGQAFILAELFNREGLSQEEVRAVLKMDKGTITRGLQRLEENGFIARRHDREDRRVVRVHVTERARAIEQEFFEVLYGWNEGILNGLSGAEQEQVLSLLQRMAANAESMARGW